MSPIRLTLTSIAALGPIGPALPALGQTIATDVQTFVQSRCERAALPLECLNAGQAYYYSQVLVRRCSSGSDDLRFSQQERNQFGRPVQAAVIAKCQDASNACLANWRIFLDRRRREGEEPISRDEIERRTNLYGNCGIRIPEVQY